MYNICIMIKMSYPHIMKVCGNVCARYVQLVDANGYIHHIARANLQNGRNGLTNTASQ